MTDALTLTEKANILYKQGFLRYEDMPDAKRIEDRWHVYKNIPQRSPRTGKQKPQ